MPKLTFLETIHRSDSSLVPRAFNLRQDAVSRTYVIFPICIYVHIYMHILILYLLVIYITKKQQQQFNGCPVTKGHSLNFITGCVGSANASRSQRQD